MNGGIIQQIGKPADIYKRPANVFVSTFIGLSNLLDGRVHGSGSSRKVSFDGTSYETVMDNLSAEAKDKEPVILSVRPEEFDIHTDGGTAGIRGEIVSSIFLGLTTHYFIHLENGKDIEVLETREDHDIIPDGSAVTLTV